MATHGLAAVLPERPEAREPTGLEFAIQEERDERGLEHLPRADQFRRLAEQGDR